MNLTWFIAKKINFSKDNKKNLSQIIIRIGQIAVILGVIISLLTISIGFGAKKFIKESLADFNGHIVIKNLDANNSLNSSLLKTHNIDYKSIINNNEINHIQKFASKSGVIRTKETFDGLIIKGYSSDFDRERFKKFLKEGEIPIYSKDSLSNDVLISKKIADNFNFKIGSFFIMYFISENQKPIYRKFQVKGIFKTDIKNIDENFIIGDLKHIQKLNKWNNNQFGGYEIFLKDIEKLDLITPEISKNIGFESIIEKSTDTYIQIISWIDLFDTNIYVILIIMLIVVLINLIMVLLILIIERIQFIGIMKTLGATNFKIQLIFVNYTLLIMIPGLIIGNFLSLIILLIQKYFKIIKLNPDNYFFEAVPVYLNLGYFIGLSVILLFIALIVLIFPSFIISKISPIKVLKFD